MDLNVTGTSVNLVVLSPCLPLTESKGFLRIGNLETFVSVDFDGFRFDILPFHLTDRSKSFLKGSYDRDFFLLILGLILRLRKK